MNIYLLIEDGEGFCVKAKTMSEAVLICKKSYLEDREEEDRNFNLKHEEEYYDEQILESCSLIGQLKN